VVARSDLSAHAGWCDPSTAQMADAGVRACCDILIGVAAAADYTPVRSSAQKIKKSGNTLMVELKPTTDRLATVTQRQNPPFCVGFAAES
jgi:phosphopantothenoylcysteine synthetase/decarboxylase